jgi:hypothetical protein
MISTSLSTTLPSPSTTFPPNWYTDPWGVAPLRWWNGQQWTPVLYGPYGEAWPLPVVAPPPFVAKGPGIKGGGVAGAGAGVGFAATVIAVIAFGATTKHFNVNNPWFLLVSQLALWVGFVGAVFWASRRNGSGSLVRDYGLSLPRWSDVGLGFVGGVVARLLPLALLVLYVLSYGGFGQSNNVSLRRAPRPGSSWSRWLWWALPSWRSCSFAAFFRAPSPGGSVPHQPSSLRR